MGSGKSNPEKTLLYQIGDVINLVQEGARDVADVSRVQAALINDDEIRIRPRKDRRAHIRSNYSTWEEALEAAQCKLEWSSDQKSRKGTLPFIVQSVDTWVAPVGLYSKTTVHEVFEKYPNLVNPIQLLNYCATPEGRGFLYHELVFTQWRYQGYIWRAYICRTQSGLYLNLDADVDTKNNVQAWSGHHYALVLAH